MNSIPVNQSILDHDRMITLKRQIKAWVASNGKSSFGWGRAVCSEIDNAIGRENRNEFLGGVFGHPISTSKELSEAEMFALAMWGMPKKSPTGIEFGSDFIHDLEMLQRSINHQGSLPGM